MGKLKFDKRDNNYYVTQGEQYLTTIHTFWNEYRRANYYEVDGKTFNYIREAKAYCNEVYGG